jgi:methionyl-tRNA formyltransferase
VRIVFWGTPEFALPSLHALLGEGHDVVAVVTQPDRPAGRGRAERMPPVKVLAESERIPVLQPERARGDEFLTALASYEPELSIVIAYGQILRREVLQLPVFGSINVHASLLPELRGAAPINWAIARGHERTGITIMRMSERMDAGPILMQVAEPIGPDETASELTARLSEIGAEVLVEALALLDASEVDAIEQDDALATFAPRITRDDARVVWSESATGVSRRIRAMDAIPGAWTTFVGGDLKLFRPRPDDAFEHDQPPGTVLAIRPDSTEIGVIVACGGGAVSVREVQPAGGRRMATTEWLRGRPLEPGSRFV